MRRTPKVISDDLLKRLRSNNPEVREAAERSLHALPEGLQALLNTIAIEEGQRRWHRRHALHFILGTIAFYVALIALIEHFIHIDGIFDGIGGIVGSSLIGFFTMSQKQQNATRALTQYNDVRAVGPFTMGLAFQDRKLRKAVEAKLVQLLPQMRASHAAYLDSVQRTMLNKQLDRKQANPDLVKAILLAWQQVGDEQAIPYVERLSQDVWRNPEIRQAAIDCLPFLRQRAEEIRSAQTLLRASDGGKTHPGELLRAASPEVAVNADELLRAEPATDMPAGDSRRLSAEEQATIHAGTL